MTYKPKIIHYDGEGDPHWQFVERDVPTVTGQVFAANVEMLTDFDGNLVGFTIYEPNFPQHDLTGRVEVPSITSDRTSPSPIVDEVAVTLASCPFCGATPHRGKMGVQYDQLHGEPFQRYRVWCPHGCASIDRINEEQTRAAWNTRHAGTPVAWLLNHPHHGERLSQAAITDGDRSLGWVDTPLYALVSLTSPPKAARLRVKPLEWRAQTRVPDAQWSETLLRQRIGHHNLGRYAGSYSVQEMSPGGKWGWWCSWTSDREPEGVEDTEEAAQAACQADFVARISTVLLPPTADRIATLERELEEARRHVELLQNKINGPRECACAYDSPNDICALHSPQLTASQAEVERLRAALGWYADRSNYGFRVDPDGRLYPQKVILDNGDRARSAIDQYPTPAEDAPTNKGEMG